MLCSGAVVGLNLLKAAKLRERLGQNDRALNLYRKAGNLEALDRIRIESVDLHQPQLDRVRQLMARQHPQLAMTLAKKRRKLIGKTPPNTGYSNVNKSGGRVVEESYNLDDAVIECQALVAEWNGNGKSAAVYWWRIQNQARSELAQDNAIKASPTPQARAWEWMKLGQIERALENFEAASDRNGATQARARICEGTNDWKRADDLWPSVGLQRLHAACMARLARTTEDWAEAAQWRLHAGERTRASDAARATERRRVRRKPALHF